MPSTTVGDLVFRNLNDLESFTRKKLNSQDFSGTDIFWKDLVLRHPNAKEKIGAGFKTLLREKNQWGNAYVTFIERIDGSIVDISVLKCAKAKDTSDKAKLLQAMRVAIVPSILRFKKTKPLDCEECGEVYRPEIHHVIPFKDLSETFLKKHLAPVAFDSCAFTFRPIFKKQDEDFKNKWIHYHDKHSKLQVLCKNCHIKKRQAP
jgi:hypothetical protein